MSLAEKLRHQTEEAQARIKKEKEEKEALARKEELLSAQKAAWIAMSNAATEGRFCGSVHVKPRLVEEIMTWLEKEGFEFQSQHINAHGLQAIWVSWAK